MQAHVMQAHAGGHVCSTMSCTVQMVCRRRRDTPLLKVVSLRKVLPKERLMVVFNQEDLVVMAAKLPDGIA